MKKRIKCLIARLLMAVGIIKSCKAPALPDTAKCADKKCPKKAGKTKKTSAKK